MSFKTLRRRKLREMGEAIFHFSGIERVEKSTVVFSCCVSLGTTFPWLSNDSIRYGVKCCRVKG